MSLQIPLTRKVDPLEPGQMIVVKGLVQGENFAVNLATGQNLSAEPLDDIGLHLSFRPGDKVVIANSYAKGAWQKEEKHKIESKPGERMDVRIRALRDRYQIYVNLLPAFQFEHRIPAGILTVVHVQGSISLSEFHYGKGTYYSTPCEVPCKGLHRNSIVHVSGIVEPKCDQFQINLKSGGTNAVHFNVRFKENVVIRNHNVGGEWGEEEREGDFPFKKGRVFDVFFVVGDASYRIEVDDVPFCVYKQFVPADKIDAIHVEGDVDLFRVDHN